MSQIYFSILDSQVTALFKTSHSCFLHCFPNESIFFKARQTESSVWFQSPVSLSLPVYAQISQKKKKKKERMKMVKQHLFSTKEKQTKCQETPAFSPLPFYQQNCASPGWLAHHCPVFPHLVPFTVTPQSLKSQACTTEGDLTRSIEWETAILRFQGQEKRNMSTVQGLTTPLCLNPLL